MTMVVDKKATAEARKRHNGGVLILRKALAQGWKGGIFMHVGKQLAAVDYSPFRPRAGCPPLRSEAQKAKHLRRKRARAARRLNRG
jgi:hypothetical protein